MAGYNLTRSVETLLEKTESLPPSFTVHLYSEYWTLNNGSKFLYNNQIASFLDDIRAHRIPVDFLELFDSAKVPFYDGCMIVELLDHRPQKNKDHNPEKPERTRVVLYPNSESIWMDICLLNQKHGGLWTDNDALEIEARLLLATSDPLCLDPDPHLTRIANHVLRVSTPTVPISLKRKAISIDPEEEESDKARRAKIMQFMNPRASRSHAPSYRILDAIERAKVRQNMPPDGQPAAQQISQHVAPIQVPWQAQSSPAPAPTQGPSPTSAEDSAKKLKKGKPEAGQSPYANSDGGTATPTPAPHQHNVNQFHMQHPNQRAPTMAQAPLQPQMYASVQASTEAVNRTASPAQVPYAQSPQAQSSQPSIAPRPVPLPQHSQAAFQPPVPSAQFLNAPPPGTRNGQPKPNGNPQGTPVQANLAPANAPSQGPSQAQLYAHQMQQQMHNHAVVAAANAASQQRGNLAQNQNGRSTPHGPAPSQTPVNAAQAIQRGSPLVTNQALTSRSPMPPNQQPTHPAVHQHPNFTQFNPQLRGMVPGNAQAMANMVQSAQAPSHSQDQTHPAPMMQYPVYGYPQMNYSLPPAGYGWPMGMGRGLPNVVNGQPMRGMVAAPQQMPVAPGKGNLPGR